MCDLHAVAAPINGRVTLFWDHAGCSASTDRETVIASGDPFTSLGLHLLIPTCHKLVVWMVLECGIGTEAFGVRYGVGDQHAEVRQVEVGAADQFILD